MTDAISVEGVTKRFSLSAASGRSAKQLALDFLRGGSPKGYTALDDVSFSVGKGETLGIIGANGAGKSTLLSIIAGTMSPTKGRVRTSGRISSLLELGAGFHPDLTGRENVFLYGSIMNVPRSTMKKRFDDIVSFAGVGEYIDQPVRHYSSGMYVRLGFSVAVQIDPDILLVDEVLAVGDSDFQQRCLKKMASFRSSGKTLLLISHDLGAIQSVSDRIAILDRGKIVDIGAPAAMIEKYNESVYSRQWSTASTAWAGKDGNSLEWGTREAVVTGTALLDADGNEMAGSVVDGKLRVKVSYRAAKRIEEPVFGFAVEHKDHGVVYGTNTLLQGAMPPFIGPGEGAYVLEVDTSSLHPGGYMLSFSIHSKDHLCNYHRLERSLPFVVARPHSSFEGVASLPVKYRFL